jgi:hypothetical protein
VANLGWEGVLRNLGWDGIYTYYGRFYRWWWVVVVGGVRKKGRWSFIDAEERG